MELSECSYYHGWHAPHLDPILLCCLRILFNHISGVWIKTLPVVWTDGTQAAMLEQSCMEVQSATNGAMPLNSKRSAAVLVVQLQRAYR